ncbi:unnamed protein product, partial [Sphacelaria rigidula]
VRPAAGRPPPTSERAHGVADGKAGQPSAMAESKPGQRPQGVGVDPLVAGTAVGAQAVVDATAKEAVSNERMSAVHAGKGGGRRNDQQEALRAKQSTGDGHEGRG